VTIDGRHPEGLNSTAQPKRGAGQGEDERGDVFKAQRAATQSVSTTMYGMTTSASSTQTKWRRSFVPATALARSVSFDPAMMHVELTDGRIVSCPLAWFPVLKAATPEQRSNYEIGGGGIGLHWPDLDEDLSLAGLMAGADPNSR